jgi:hypothetical protein
MEKKSYRTPQVSEIGSINESVHANRQSFVEDGSVVRGDKVLIHLTKSDV